MGSKSVNVIDFYVCFINSPRLIFWKSFFLFERVAFLTEKSAFIIFNTCLIDFLSYLPVCLHVPHSTFFCDRLLQSQLQLHAYMA